MAFIGELERVGFVTPQQWHELFEKQGVDAGHRKLSECPSFLLGLALRVWSLLCSAWSLFPKPKYHQISTERGA